MYLWNIAKLKKDLKSGPLPEIESLKYLCISAFMRILIGLHDYQSSNAKTVFSIISLFSLIYYYYRNGANKGVNFIQRFLAIGMVNGIRVIVLFFPINIVLALLVDKYVKIDLAILIAPTLIMYIYSVGKDLHEVAMHAHAVASNSR